MVCYNSSEASLIAQLVKNLPAMQENSGSIPGLGRSAGEGIKLPIPVFWPGEVHGFLGGSDGKVSACNVGDLGLIPGLGRSPGKGNGNPL